MSACARKQQKKPKAIVCFGAMCFRVGFVRASQISDIFATDLTKATYTQCIHMHTLVCVCVSEWSAVQSKMTYDLNNKLFHLYGWLMLDKIKWHCVILTNTAGSIAIDEVQTKMGHTPNAIERIDHNRVLVIIFRRVCFARLGKFGPISSISIRMFGYFDLRVGSHFCICFP